MAGNNEAGGNFYLFKADKWTCVQKSKEKTGEGRQEESLTKIILWHLLSQQDNAQKQASVAANAAGWIHKIRTDQ